MRPIDTLREKIDLWKKSTTDTALMSVLHDVLQQIDVAIYEMDHQEAASPWRRVEEELPPVGEVVWCYFSGSKLYEALALLLVTKEMDLVWQDGTHCFNFRNGVTHWMTIEPPKEDSQ